MPDQMPLAEYVERVTGLLPRVARAMYGRWAYALVRHNITLQQYLVLEVVHERVSMRIKDIAAELTVSLPAASNLIDRLHGMGLVERRRDERDRRVVWITLTQRAACIAVEIRQCRKDAIRQVLVQLTPQDREAHLNIMTKILAILYPDTK